MIHLFRTGEVENWTTLCGLGASLERKDFRHLRGVWTTDQYAARIKRDFFLGYSDETECCPECKFIAQLQGDDSC